MSKVFPVEVASFKTAIHQLLRSLMVLSGGVVYLSQYAWYGTTSINKTHLPNGIHHFHQDAKIITLHHLVWVPFLAWM